MRSKAFSLVEIMVALAILAILSTVAIPSYRDYVLRAKVTTALNTLINLRPRFEQIYQDGSSVVSNGTPNIQELFGASANTTSGIPFTVGTSVGDVIAMHSDPLTSSNSACTNTLLGSSLPTTAISSGCMTLCFKGLGSNGGDAALSYIYRVDKTTGIDRWYCSTFVSYNNFTMGGGLCGQMKSNYLPAGCLSP